MTTPSDMDLDPPSDQQHGSNTLPCPACMACISPFQSMEDHYWDSDEESHPKCRPCALGFENREAWTAVSPHLILVCI